MEMLIYITLCLLGLLTHWLKKIAENRGTGKDFSFKEYWIENWIEALIAITGSASLFLVGFGFDQLNELTAFLAGYTGNSAADILGKRANRQGNG